MRLEEMFGLDERTAKTPNELEKELTSKGFRKIEETDDFILYSIEVDGETLEARVGLNRYLGYLSFDHIPKRESERKARLAPKRKPRVPPRTPKTAKKKGKKSTIPENSDIPTVKEIALGLMREKGFSRQYSHEKAKKIREELYCMNEADRKREQDEIIKVQKGVRCEDTYSSGNDDQTHVLFET